MTESRESKAAASFYELSLKLLASAYPNADDEWLNAQASIAVREVTLATLDEAITHEYRNPASVGRVPRRILIVDDHPVVRRGLGAKLAGEPWVEKVYVAATAADAIREAVTHQIEVIAMNVTLPDGDGIEATSAILRRLPETRSLSSPSPTTRRWSPGRCARVPADTSSRIPTRMWTWTRCARWPVAAW